MEKEENILRELNIQVPSMCFENWTYFTGFGKERLFLTSKIFIGSFLASF